MCTWTKFKMKRLVVYIDDEQFTTLRKISYDKIASLSAVVRWCITDYCNNNSYPIDISPELEFEDVQLKQFFKELEDQKKLMNIDNKKG